MQEPGLDRHGWESEMQRGAEEISPGDVAAAINGYRAVFEHLVTDRGTGELETGREDLEP